MIAPHATSLDTQYIHLTQLAAYSSFGAWLRTIRNRRRDGLRQERLTQDQVAQDSERFFRARRRPIIDRRAYGSLERDGRVPLFEELDSLFLTFVEWYKIDVTEIECKLFIHLAKQRILGKRKKAEEITDKQWNDLERELLSHIGNKRHIRLIVKDEYDSLPQEVVSEDPESRRLKSIARAVGTDTSHLLEREEWARVMLALMEATPQKKLVVIQGSIGAGKTHAVTLLIQRLIEQTNNEYIIPYTFDSGSDKTPEDHLDVFLATVYADLTMTPIDETMHIQLDERIDQLLVAIKARTEQGQKVVFFLDDVQEIFPFASEWSSSWMHFFETFVRELHASTIYLTTRTWPGWSDRRHVYVEETELPELSVEASFTIWQRYGYNDVPLELLEKVGHRFGRHPQMIEMLAYQNKQRKYTFGWASKEPVSYRKKKNLNEERLEALLSKDVAFDIKTDRQAKTILQYAITSNLSHQARGMLECLAISPLGLPLSLLNQEFPRADEAYGDLINASLVDLNAATSQRAMIVPLVREAQVQSLLTDARKEGIEARVTDLYDYWLTSLQDFTDDAEKAALIAEMVVRYIRQRQLLKAAELFISFGWLCTLFGHMTRIQRVFEEMIVRYRGKEEDVRHEVGCMILQHRITVHSGQKVERDERDQIYQDIYKKITAGEVVLQPHSELEVLHNMLLFYNRKGKLAEANVMFDQTLERLQYLGAITPEVYALFLFDRGRLMSYRADKEKQLEASLKYTQASVDYVKECVANWRLCLKHALPLQEHYVQFKLARALNDLACDLRTLHQYPEAQLAIEESIKLKKKSGTLPHSIAIALSECSQILAAQGKIREALSINAEAKEILEQSTLEGDDVHKPELGLVLKERANIFLLQARLTEAKSLLEQAINLMGNKPLRQKDREEAKAQIERIQLITSSAQTYKLDRRWFSRFSELVDFNDTKWLSQAGPFTEEESLEWERLSTQEDERSYECMSKIMVQSRKREFTRSLEKKCEPIIYYPYLPLKDVRNRINGLTTLYKEIEAQEGNMIVRRLYAAAINEHLTFLHLCEAIAFQDQATAMQCNLQLYGRPSEREFRIAMQQLCNMLYVGSTHKLASTVAQEALTQLEEWGISPRDIVADDLFIPTFDQIQQVNHKLLASEKKMFSTATICKFFQDVLVMYGESDWNVYVNPARDHTTVDPNIRELILPEKSFSVQKVRQLLAEEIETHSYRAIAGRNSPLALLGSGLANHLATDEGLAYHYVQDVNRTVYGEYEEKRWNATLTTGLVSGVLTRELSFSELRDFLEKMFLVSELLDNSTWEDAFEFARQAAWRRCCRVFRGGGCISLKDRVYLQGHLEVSNYLSSGGEEQRLYVGCIGIDQLDDMAELGILSPSYPCKHLALATDLAERLASYES